jgi:FtsP/CotA-like multicopper oxidase with cupredoxin domain
MMDMGMSMANMPGMKMGAMKGMDMSGMQMDGMKGMDMSGMKMSGDMSSSGSAMPVVSDSHISDMQGMSVVGMTPFPQPGPDTTRIGAMGQEAMMKAQPAHPVRLHVGPQVASVPASVETRLNDPGDGLEHNGRRVLTYADLRARYRGVDGRPPTRTIELHLTGNMGRFIWGFDGRKFSEAEPVRMKLGERVRIVLINDTMMEHPIHLHGLWSELENGHGEFNPYKHTISVKPAERVSYLVSADTPGRWAYHCHLIYHMHMGMFRTVVVS